MPYDRMRSFDGDSASNIASCKILNGQTFGAFVLHYSGNLSDIGEIRHIVNTKVERRWRNAVDIDNENQHFGRAAASAADGRLIIDIGRYHQSTKVGRESTYLGTGLKPTEKFPQVVNTQYLEVDLKAGWVGKLYLDADMEGPRLVAAILKRRITQETVTISDEYEITDLLHAGEEVSKIIFHTDAISEMRIERNGKTAWRRTTKTNEQIQIDEGLFPAALPAGAGNAFCFFPGEKGDIGGVFVATPDTRFYLKTTAADNFDVTIESIGILSASR